MNFQQILDAIAAEPPRQPGLAIVPSREMIAFTVKHARTLTGWKRATLASLADVSVSSVERVERAEAVAPETLDKIAVALGYETGAFTAPRQPIPMEEVAADFIERYGELQQVDVRVIETERQVRELARCHGSLVHRPLVGAEHDALIVGLTEWLDLASFVLSEEFSPNPRDRNERGRRELYTSILDYVGEITASGFT